MKLNKKIFKITKIDFYCILKLPLGHIAFDFI